MLLQLRSRSILHEQDGEQHENETTPGATRASRFVCPYGLFPWLTSRHQPTQLSVFSPNTSPHLSSHSYTKCSPPSSSNFPRNGQHSIPIGPRGRASGLLEIAVSAMLRPADPSIQLATLGPEHCRYSPNDLWTGIGNTKR